MPQRSSVKQLIRNWATAFLVPRPVIGAFYLPHFFRDWRNFQRLSPEDKLRWQDSYPCLVDQVVATPFDPHYFYQGAWLARRLAETKPVLHLDIGSSALTMGVLSATSPTVFLDFRPLKVNLTQFTSIAGDAAQLPFKDASVHSLSCLHVIEHIGLGRYGDRLNPGGSRTAFMELARVLAKGGKLYLAVPVGRQRICFNAHRVFSPQTILTWETGLSLDRFALVRDDGVYVDPAKVDDAEAFEYGCGLFEFLRS
jgi:SAM-dependent methyltransferase